MQTPILSLTNLLIGLGALTAFTPLYTLLTFIFVNLRTGTLSRYRHGPSAPYALVTGASDGIGLAFVHELLDAGFNVIIHGRNESKLRDITIKLRAKYPKQDVDFYVADAAAVSTQAVDFVEDLLEKLAGKRLTVLINNVGGMVGVDPIFAKLEDRTPKQVEHIITLNSTYPTQMVRALLPKLKENEPSLVVNISSMASFLPAPFNAVYNGSKAYLEHWSHTMTNEMRATKKDVEIMVIEVGTVLTTGNPLVKTENLFTPSAKTMARSTLDKIGCGYWRVVGYWPHALQKLAVMSLPHWVMVPLVVALGSKMKAQQEEEAKKKG